MPNVTSDFLGALFTNYRVIFNEGFEEVWARDVQTQLGRLAMQVDSTTYQETYTWLGTVPKMREWFDERAFDAISGFSYSLPNRHFESSIEVDRDTLEDDRYNLYRPHIQQLALEAARFPIEIAMQQLAGGNAATAISYDGTPFFGTTHVDVSGQATQSNIFTGTGTTLSAIRADLVNARTAMRRFADVQGRPMNIAPDLVVAPPELQDVFTQLLNSEIIALSSGTQQTNILKGAFDLMINPYLTDPNDWYLLATGYPVKPLIYQVRKAPEFVAADDPKQDRVFLKRRFAYGVDSRFNVGFGLWQTAARVTN